MDTLNNDRRNLLKAASVLAVTVIADGRILQRGGQFFALDYAEVLREAIGAGKALQVRAG